MPSAKTFFSDRPIAYHPILAKVCGSVTAALFLSQIAYWSDKGASGDGWIWKTQAEMEDETGLSRSEQETARRILKELGILQEERRGVPARMWYLIDWDTLTNLIDEYEQTRLRESRKLDEAKPANYSETTTENTPSLSQGASEFQEAFATLSTSFQKYGGVMNPKMMIDFETVYKANPDHRDKRLQHAIETIETKRNFWRAIDAFREWTIPKPNGQYGRAAKPPPKEWKPATPEEIAAHRARVAAMHAEMGHT